MRTAGKIFRWTLIVFGAASIASTLAMMIVNSNVHVTQELGVMSFWLAVLVIAGYFEYRSNVKHKTKKSDESS